MTKEDILERIQKAPMFREERLNETGRTLADIANVLYLHALELLVTNPDVAAKLLVNADKTIRASFQADKTEDARQMAKLAELQEVKRNIGDKIKLIK